MEEELSELVAATLMKKTGNKYETDFFIVSAEAQEKIYEHLRSVAPDLTKAIIAAAEFEQDFNGKNNFEWCTGNQPKEDMRWTFLMMKTDTVNFDFIDAVGKPKYVIPHIISDHGVRQSVQTAENGIYWGWKPTTAMSICL